MPIRNIPKSIWTTCKAQEILAIFLLVHSEESQKNCFQTKILGISIVHRTPESLNKLLCLLVLPIHELGLAVHSQYQLQIGLYVYII